MRESPSTRNRPKILYLVGQLNLQKKIHGEMRRGIFQIIETGGEVEIGSAQEALATMHLVYEIYKADKTGRNVSISCKQFLNIPFS